MLVKFVFMTSMKQARYKEDCAAGSSNALDELQATDFLTTGRGQ